MTRVIIAIFLSVFLAAAAFATQLCPACGAANPDENNFCEACGTPLKPMVTCPKCGAKCAEGTAACAKCGHVFLKPKKVTIKAEPAKAIIYVNGIEKGKGPVELTLAPGETAEVEGRVKGYYNIKKNISYKSAAGDVELTLTKSETERPAPSAVKKAPKKAAGFWEGNTPIWISLGTAAACFGYGFYEDTQVKANYDKYVEAPDGQTMSYYRSECQRHARLRDVAYGVGGAFGGASAYFVTKKLFFTARPGNGGLYFILAGDF